MDGYVIGLAVGLGAGIAIGISMGRKQKPWSEMTPGERKARIISIVAGGILLIVGVVVLFVRLSS